MNKRYVILYLLIALMVISAFAISKVIYKKTNEEKNKIELTYKTNCGVAYKWEFQIEDESIVKFVKKYNLKDESDDPNIAGGVISTNYVFKGLKEGKTTVTFNYVNIVDGSIAKKDVVTLKVDKNKNIALQGM